MLALFNGVLEELKVLEGWWLGPLGLYACTNGPEEENMRVALGMDHLGVDVELGVGWLAPLSKEPNHQSRK